MSRLFRKASSKNTYTPEQRNIPSFLTGRRWICAIALCMAFLLIHTASAELSTNLGIQKTMNRNNKKIESETYTDAAGNPVTADDKGYATVKYTYTSGNRISKTEYLDPSGNLTNSVDGVAQIIYTYAVGGLAKTEYLNAAGQPVNGPEGYALQETKYTYGKHKSTWEYDANGNPVNLHRISDHMKNKPGLIVKDGWYDTAGNPAEGPEGYSWVEYGYAGTRVSRTAYYDVNGELYFNAGKGFAIQETVYENRNVKEKRYYGDDGELTAGPEGFARAVYSYHRKDNHSTTKIMYYNADGSLFFTEKGYCGIEQARTKWGTICDERYYIGENEQRGRSTDGYSRETRTYNMRGKLSEQRFYDENNKLMIPETVGYAMLKNTYSGNYLTRTEYFNENIKPMIGPDGYYAAENKYIDRLLVKTTYYDTDGKTLINGKDGYARIEYERDKDKKVLSEKYFDAEGNRVVVRDNADEIRYTWVNGNKASESYWANGAPAVNSKGAHEIRYEYTGANRVSTQVFLDTEGNITTIADGYARLENQFNSQGKVMCTLYYGVDGELVTAPGKEYAYTRTISMRDKDYLGEEEVEPEQEEDPDEEPAEVPEENEAAEEEPGEEEPENHGGDTLYVEYYGTDGQLMNLAAGYAVIVRQVDENGKTTEEAYLDKDNRKVLTADGIQAVRYTIGEDGFASSIAYYGLEDEPVINTRTRYHRVDRTYLDGNHITSETWFDTEGKPMTTGNTYCRIEREFDERKNPVIERYCDENGLQIARSEGYDEIHQVFNEQNKVSRIEYYLEGQPFCRPAGYAGVERDYDELGRVIAERYYGTDGVKGPVTDGYDEIHQAYNEQGKISRIDYYLNGEPFYLPAGYAAVEREYDEAGHIITERYYDGNGEKVLLTDGYHFYTQVYGEDGYVASLAYFGLDGEAVVNTRTGYHRLDRTYLDSRHVTSEAWFGVEDEPITLGDTFVRVEREFDERGNPGKTDMTKSARFMMKKIDPAGLATI